MHKKMSFAVLTNLEFYKCFIVEQCFIIIKHKRVKIQQNATR